MATDPLLKPAHFNWSHEHGFEVCMVDYETYYDSECSVKTLGAQAYTEHPDFDAYMVSIVTPEWEWVGHPSAAPWASIDGWVWTAVNCQFDWTVHNWVMKRYELEVKPSKWVDVAGLAAYLGYNRSLAGMVKGAYDFELNKTMRTWMKGRRWAEVEVTNPAKATELLEYCLDDSRWGFKFFIDHCTQWPAEEMWASGQLIRRGMSGVTIDKLYLDKSIEHLEKHLLVVEESLPWCADGEKPTSPKALAMECRKNNITPPKSTAEDSPEREFWELTYGEQFPWVAAMTSWRKTNRLLKVLKKMDQRVSSELTVDPYKPVMCFSVKYFGAHTGRDSGDAGLNMHGQAREDVEGVSQRNVIVAPDGYKIGVIDQAQIEPRIAHWLVDDWEWLEAAAEPGVDMYETHARRTMGYDLPESLKAMAKIDKKYDKLRRLAKAREIGLGYQCGKVKFIIVAKTLAGLTITPKESAFNVSDWRQKNSKIVRYWNKLQAAFERSVGQDFELELPSGRVLRYFNLVRRQGQVFAQVERGGTHRAFYGGKLFENMVQAIGRDILQANVYSMEERGIWVPFKVHDENVVYCRDGTDDFMHAQAIMLAPPAWIAGLPIGIEAHLLDKYAK